MAALDRTRALMAELAAVIGLPDLPQDPSGGYRLVVAGESEILIYGGDDVTLLLVAPLAPLPTGMAYPLANYLLRMNMFNAPTMPFITAIDEGGAVILWGRVVLADFDGTGLARLVDNLADLAIQVRGELAAPPASTG